MANYQVRDTLFRDYFNTPERLLSLGNALLGTNYTDSSTIVINTLEGNLYNNIKNDISFLLEDHWLILIEHQSTINNNMPFRMLLYAGELYKHYAAGWQKKLYRPSLQRLPAPEFFVFYDGMDTNFDHQTLRLSDAFGNPNSKMELEVECFNLNYGLSQSIKDCCSYLNEYSLFSNVYKEYLKAGMSLEQAIRAAIDYAKTNNVMLDYILKKESEVIDMFGFEWNENEYREAIREDAIEQGREQGKLEGKIDLIKSLLKLGTPIETIEKASGLSKDAILNLRQPIAQH